MHEQVTIEVTIGEAIDEDTGMTLQGVIEEQYSVTEREDFVEPGVRQHIRDKFGIGLSEMD